MAFSNSKLAGAPLPPVTGERDLGIIKRPMIQVKGSKEQKLQALETLNISRRETLLYLTAETLGGLAILSTGPAEALVGRREMKKKVMEKLKKLKEKAHLQNPKTENGVNTPPAQSPAKGNEFSLLPPPIPFPNAHEEDGVVGPLVEAIIP